MKKIDMKSALSFILLLLSFFTSKGVCAYSRPDYMTSQRVLMVGDSLSVGPFGREMQTYFTDQFGDKRFYMYASCGSSPEHWLASEPVFHSKCGSRVKTPRGFSHSESEKGRPAEVFSTPKLENLLRESRPNVVIIQLGTNWFDRLVDKPGPEELARLGGILDRFADTVLSSETRPKLIWITPPDSERFRKVQGDITKLITSIARQKRFNTINSSGMVRYVQGQTGGDGVHYYGQDAVKWADGVKNRLRGLL